jgi:hypothetical protein
MVATCSKCGEEFPLKPDHRGFANVCEACFRPHELTGYELTEAIQALNEKNESARRAQLAEDRRRIEGGWLPESAPMHLAAYQEWIANEMPDSDLSFVIFFQWMKPSKRHKFYWRSQHQLPPDDVPT